MKVGLFSNATSKHIKRWAIGLADYGYKVEVLHPGKTSKLDFDFPEHENIKLRNIGQPFGANLLTRIVRYAIRRLMGDQYLNRKLAGKLERVVKNEEIDVLLVHGMQFHGQVAGYVRGVPIVIMLAGSDIYRRKKDKGTTKEYQQAFDRATIIEAQSRAIIDKAKEEFRFDDQKVRVFPWGIDFKNYSFEEAKSKIPEVRRRYGIEEDRFVIFSCRSMLPLYNWKNIILGFSKVSAEPVHLIMVRGLATEKELEEAKYMIKGLGIEEKVTIIPEFVSFDEMVVLYSLADATVSIPDSDNLSDVIWETMAFRCIPILARVPAYFEALDENHAIYLSDRTPETIAEGILKALKNDWEKTIEENYQKALSNSWDETLAKQDSLFEDAISYFSGKNG
ncbi:MAG: glycosyltransferase [Methanobacteriota archaeon]|nr:MAG: glycosyltransferase [Euryarchaeota archaeon]